MSMLREYWEQVKRFSKREQVLAASLAICVVIILVFLILLATKNDDGICYTPQCIKASEHVHSMVDDAKDPCEDFHQFVCGNYLKTAIEHDYASSISSLNVQKNNALKQLIMENRADEDQLTISFKNQRKFFRVCMNTSAIDDDKDETFLDDLKYVTGGWPLSLGYALDIPWPEIMVRARERGLIFNYFLDIDFNIDFNTKKAFLELRPPSKEYYDKHLWSEANVRNLIEMAEHWGNHSVSASWEMRQTLEFAANLNHIVEKAHEAGKNWTLNERKTKIMALKNGYSPRIHWLEFLRNITGLTSLKATDEIISKVDDEYFKNLYYLLQKTSNKFWTNYIVILQVANECRSLSEPIRKLCEPLIDLDTKKSRQDYCFDEAVSEFVSVVETQYIRKVATPDKRGRITKMINNIREQMKTSLSKIKWMDEETKRSSTEQLEQMKSAVGWTDLMFNETEYERLFGYSKFELSENIIQIRHLLNKAYLDYRFNQIQKPFDFHSEHIMSVPILDVNAFYLKYWDVLILAAPMLLEPLYDINRPEYLNYGALGSIIGHEMTHAFAKTERQARQTFGDYVKDRWTNRTHQNFDVEKRCIIEEYERFALDAGLELQNNSTSLDENIADFNGVNVAYVAYQKWLESHGNEYQLPGVKYSANQLFWIMSGTYMCAEPKLKSPEKIYTHPEQRGADQHAIGPFRINGPIRNSPYFASDFGCQIGRKMNPREKCRLFL